MRLTAGWSLVCAGVFGLLMRAAANLAGQPGQAWIQDVVNWGALWLVVPFVAGRASRRDAQALALAAAAGSLQVAFYYGTSNVAAFKVFWLVVGAAGCGLVGLAGRRSRQHPGGGLLVLPVLLVIEPVLWATGFVALGRGVGAHRLWSGVGEAAVGVVAVVAIGLQARYRARRRVPELGNINVP